MRMMDHNEDSDADDHGDDADDHADDTYIHAYIHPCMHACMHAYMHACMYAYIHTWLGLVVSGNAFEHFCMLSACKSQVFFLQPGCQAELQVVCRRVAVAHNDPMLQLCSSKSFLCELVTQFWQTCV